MVVVSLIFFFFQAEDGIRDDLVTGVQTCALPISQHEAKKASVPTAALRNWHAMKTKLVQLG